jgi:hypothetical protein
MVPHSLFVSSDRHVDLALNLLTLLVGGGLLATAAVLTFMWLRPAAPAAAGGEAGPPAWAAMSEVLLDPPRLEFEVRFPEVRLPEARFAYGAAIFRCEHRGAVTYTDRPCVAGNTRALPVRPF